MTAANTRAMPGPRNKDAPLKFRGHYAKAQPFLMHYEDLLEACGITDDAEKCKHIMKYVSTHVGKLIGVLPEYQDEDWNALKAAFLHLYDADRDTARYTSKDLRRYTTKATKRSMKSLSQWKAYLREFAKRAEWLRKVGKISDNEYLKEFWRGLPKKFRKMVMNHQKVVKSNLDLTKPFTKNKICKIIEQHLDRDRFDADITYGADSDADSDASSEEDDADDNDSDSDSEEESDESESDEESEFDYRALKKLSHKHEKTPRHKSKSRSKGSRYLPEITEPKESSNRSSGILGNKSIAIANQTKGKKDDIDSLIDQMANLKITDAKYARLYYQALKIDKDIIYALQKPEIASAMTSQH